MIFCVCLEQGWDHLPCLCPRTMRYVPRSLCFDVKQGSSHPEAASSAATPSKPRHLTKKTKPAGPTPQPAQTHRYQQPQPEPVPQTLHQSHHQPEPAQQAPQRKHLLRKHGGLLDGLTILWERAKMVLCTKSRLISEQLMPRESR